MQQLQSLAQAGTTPQRVAQRCRVVLLAGQGVANNAIARQTGLSRPTVIATRAEFARGGVAVLQQPRQRQRTRPVLTAELERRILDTTLKTKSVTATHWSSRQLAKHLGLSRIMFQRVCQRHEIHPP